MTDKQTLKPGWKQVKFGDVVRLSKARSANPEADGIERYVGLEHIDPEDLRIRRWGLVAEGTTFTTRFQSGQVLFGKRRAYQRKVAIADFEGVCSGDIYVFESANPSILLPELLPFICQTDQFFEYAVGTSAGSLSPRTNWNSLANFYFSLPSLRKQQECVQLLNSIEETIDSYNKAVLVAKNNRKSVARHLFETNLNTIRCALKSVIQDSRYGPRFSGSLYDENGSLYQIRSTDFDENGNINYTSVPRANLNPNDYEEHLLKDKDVVISRSGTCGITAIFHAQDVPTIPGAFLIRLRTNNKMLPEYLHEFFSSPIGRQLTASLARGGVQKNISGSQLLAQEIPCPDTDEQKRVVNSLLILRNSESQLNSRLSNLYKLKQSALHSIFDSIS